MASSTYIVWVQNDGTLRSLLFDCVTSVTTTLTTEVTEHPVELGANVADHIRPSTDTVQIEVFVSNEPLDDSASSLNFGLRGRVVPVELKIEPYEAPLEFTPGSAYNAIGGAIKGGISSLFGGGPRKYAAQVFKFDGSKDLVAETFQLLLEAKRKSSLFQVVTRENLFKDMVLTDCAMSRSRETGNGARLTLDFKQVRRVKISVVGAPDPAEPRAAPAVKRGAKDTAPAKNAERRKSLLKAGADALRGGS